MPELGGRGNSGNARKKTFFYRRASLRKTDLKNPDLRNTNLRNMDLKNTVLRKEKKERTHTKTMGTDGMI